MSEINTCSLLNIFPDLIIFVQKLDLFLKFTVQTTSETLIPSFKVTFFPRYIRVLQNIFYLESPEIIFEQREKEVNIDSKYKNLSQLMLSQSFKFLGLSRHVCGYTNNSNLGRKKKTSTLNKLFYIIYLPKMVLVGFMATW